MTVALAAVLAVWVALLGTAYVGRRVMKVLGSAVSVVVIACYLCLGAAALFVLGTGWQGWAGAAGMLLPTAVALLTIQFS